MEFAPVDLPELVQHRQGARVTPLNGFEAGVFPPVVPAPVAKPRGPGGVLLHRVIPFGGEQIVKGAGRLVGAPALRTGLEWLQQAEGSEAGEDRSDNGLMHGFKNYWSPEMVSSKE